MAHTAGDIDALIREEKLLSAVESQTEAWAEGRSAGIEPEIIAEAAMITALEELLRNCDEETALALIDRVRDKMLAGDFAPGQMRH